MNFIWDEPSPGLWHLVPEGAEDLGISIGKIKREGEKYFDLYFPERSPHMVSVKGSLEDAKAEIERLLQNRATLNGFLKEVGIY